MTPGRCNYLVREFPITFWGEPHIECLLPEGHDGEHLVRNERGRFYCWEPGPECECKAFGCGCIIYGELTEAEAARLTPPAPIPHKQGAEG